METELNRKRTLSKDEEVPRPTDSFYQRNFVEIANLGSEIGIGGRRLASLQNMTEDGGLERKSTTEAPFTYTHTLFGVSSPLIETISKPQLYLFWYCCLIFIQSMVINGFINSSLATLEKRYKLSSFESSFVASSYDIGCMAVVLPVSYFGNSHHKVRWLGFGGIVMGMGSFVIASPQLFSGKYEYGARIETEIPMCQNDSISEICHKQADLTNLKNYKFVLYLGAFIIGLGASPLYTLGIAYIEQIVDSKTSALFIGISTAISAIGPAVGYILCGFFLKIYVDIKVETQEMTLENTDIWVGAWWLGFTIAGIAFLLFSLPLILFPRPKRDSVKPGFQRLKAIDMNDIKDILIMSKSIILNITYLCLDIATALTLLSLSGLSTYGPKYLENMLGLTASSSTITAGIITVPTLATGALCGGIILNHFNWKLDKILMFMLITTLSSIPLLLTFFLKCEVSKMPGIDVPFHHDNEIKTSLKTSCNEDCNCLVSLQYFRPTCGVDRRTYFSPCVAGCKDKVMEDLNYKYYNCSCVDAGPEYATGYHLVDKSCPPVRCAFFYVFLTLLGAYLFITYLRGAPMVTATMRSVKPIETSLALGIQSIFSRVLGSIPGPMIFGYVIDMTCIFWHKRCGEHGNCLKYDANMYMKSFFLLMIIITSCNAMCFMVACLKRIVRSFSKKDLAAK